MSSISRLAIWMRRVLGPEDAAVTDPAVEDPARDRSVALDAAIAEYVSIRSQILFQMDRANRLATFAVAGSLTAIAFLGTQTLTPQGWALGLFGVALAVGIVALAYVGVVGEEIQAARYLRESGDWIRGQLGPNLAPHRYRYLPDLGMPPVFAWEEMMSRRPSAPRWIRLTTSLAWLEFGSPGIFGLAIWACGLFILLTDASNRTPLTIGAAIAVAIETITVLVSMAGIHRLQVAGQSAARSD